MICCFEGSALQGPFSHLFSIRSQYFSIDYARMNALYTGSLRIKISYFYPEKSNIFIGAELKWLTVLKVQEVSQ